MSDISTLQIISQELETYLDPFAKMLYPKYASQIAFLRSLSKMPIGVKDALLNVKIKFFLESLQKNDLNESVKFLSILFSNEKEEYENVIRLINYIDNAETKKVIDYIVNASRAVGNQLISISEYFRILKVLTNVLPEDLVFFKEIAISRKEYEGDVRVIDLAQNGVMALSSLQTGESIEKQRYSITSFGIKLDKYSLSYEDDERLNLWKKYDGNLHEVLLKTYTSQIEENEDGSSTVMLN